MADNSSPTSDGEAAFAALLEEARADPAVIGLVLGGSRGKGLETPLSDWDAYIVVTDEAFPAWSARFPGPTTGAADFHPITLGEFARHAAWGGDTAFDRYSFVDMTAMVDKTGEVQRLIDEKGCVPGGEISAFIHASLDHFINQVYRAAKCSRDGDAFAARLEATEAVSPLLDALFALNGGRLRPFPKYLTRELLGQPLEASPWTSEALRSEILRVLDGDIPALQAMLAACEPLFRSAGYNDVFDAWGSGLAVAKGVAARGAA
ncbi:MAG: hypothetical protein ACHP84_09690 [Caulobacterales bacterium]